MVLSAQARDHGRAGAGAWGWFLAWALAGAAYGAGVVGAATIGIVVFPIAIVATVVLLGRRPALSGLPGAALGVGAVLIYVAYVNRRGPGTVCTQHGGGAGYRCVSELSPLPFVVAGAVAVVVGVGLFVVLGRRLGRSGA